MADLDMGMQIMTSGSFPLKYWLDCPDPLDLALGDSLVSQHAYGRTASDGGLIFKNKDIQTLGQRYGGGSPPSSSFSHSRQTSYENSIILSDSVTSASPYLPASDSLEPPPLISSSVPSPLSSCPPPPPPPPRIKKRRARIIPTDIPCKCAACQADPNLQVKRPLNSFMLYQHDKRPQLAIDHRVSSIAKIIGDMWKNETIAVKQYYNDLYEEERAKFHALYPDHRFKLMPKVQKKNGRPLKSSSSRSSAAKLQFMARMAFEGTTASASMSEEAPAATIDTDAMDAFIDYSQIFPPTVTDTGLATVTAIPLDPDLGGLQEQIWSSDWMNVE